MFLLRTLFTIIIITLSLSSIAAHLPDDIEPGDSINEIQLPLTKQSAAELVRLESQGKILSVDEKSQGGTTIFHVKVLHANGKIKIYSLDAKTARTPH